MNYSTETTKILRQYATEDANMIKVNGFGAVTGTKKGCLHMSFENGIFTVNATKDNSIFQTPNVECLIEYIIDQYIVEIEA